MTIPRPLLSVVTPSFNQAKFLEETLRSIYLQNYRPIQHIVMDGGSNDASVEILKRCAEEFRSSDYSLEWVSEPDRGFADALGKGFAKAKGEIVGWLNSDDVYFDRFVVETAVQTLNGHPETDVVFGDVALISETSGLWMIWCFPNFQYRRALRGYIVPQPTLFMRRQVVERHSIASLNGVGLDNLWYLEIGREHQFFHVGRVQAADRDHGARRTHTLPTWKEEGSEYLVKYGNGYVPTSLEKFKDIATRLVMRGRGVASWAWIFLDQRIARNLAFSVWIDSPWKVFARQCTMRLTNRPELVRPEMGRWPSSKPLLNAGLKRSQSDGRTEDKELHDRAEDTAPSAPPL